MHDGRAGAHASGLLVILGLVLLEVLRNLLFHSLEGDRRLELLYFMVPIFET